ncbi:alpha/beta fold hydrolase [Chelativorans sp. AA-79]|uniref:alpha/beta fold hydrolase n=1 Tax=Chelativorans sp. AA-79 TaxID=3028735 RepID=UPI0023FA218E|nr:alpha/beta fold hydrolase [Chelativorans sp. AA-79]WEX12228.1 alpha/beta fold hydrolase [Chelativorans sp. AA-79]
MTNGDNPAIGKRIHADGISTNYHEAGQGTPVLLLHGSGIGVSAYANWERTLPALGRHFHALAIDVVGFGFTDGPDDAEFNLDYWVRHVISFMDAKQLEKVHLLGNSFGGALALAVTVRHRERIDRVVLMGSAGTKFEVPPDFNAGFGYRGRKEDLKVLLKNFTLNPSLITDDMINLRFDTFHRPGYDKIFEKLFPGSREEKMNVLVTPDEQIAGIENDVLLVHGREDRVVPKETSLHISSLIPGSELHIFGQCGHWSHRDKEARFNQLVTDFYRNGQA